MQHIVALITGFCSVAYVANHTDWRSWFKNLSLSRNDLLMVASILAEIDFLKHEAAKKACSSKETNAMIVSSV